MREIHNILNVRAVIFDFDGTIFDTENPTFEAWSEVYERHGQTLALELWRKRIGTHGAFDPAARLAQLAGEPLDPEKLRGGVRRRVRELCSSEPMPGIRELLSETRGLGLPIGIASSSSSPWVKKWLDHLGLTPFFHCICGRDHVARVKPEPDLFLLAAQKLGVAPEACLVFEDSPHGVTAAKRAGMRCIAVPNALTREATFPPAELRFESLAGVRLAEVLEGLSGRR